MVQAICTRNSTILDLMDNKVCDSNLYLESMEMNQNSHFLIACILFWITWNFVLKGPLLKMFPDEMEAWARFFKKHF